MMVGVLSQFSVAHSVLIPIFAENVLDDRELFAWRVAATGVGALAGFRWRDAVVVTHRRAAPHVAGRSCSRQRNSVLVYECRHDGVETVGLLEIGRVAGAIEELQLG